MIEKSAGMHKLHVRKANREQVDSLINSRYSYLNERKTAIICVIAIDGNETILGHLIAEEKTVSAPDGGADWFIWNIFTLPEYRRQGIASALLHEVILCARSANIQHILGSCIGTTAHMFWDKHCFCFIKYVQKIDNVNNPDEHGNYPHMIIYRVNEAANTDTKIRMNYNIQKIDNAEQEQAIKDCVPEEKRVFFQGGRETVFGFAAVDGAGKMLGFIVAYTGEIGVPLAGNEWVVPYIFVDSDFRRQGIGSALLRELTKAARATEIAQLLFIGINESESSFWYNNNLNMFRWKHLADINTTITAGLRII